MRRKPGCSNPTREGGRKYYSLILLGTQRLCTYRVQVEGLYPITDRQGKSPAWNCFPKTLLLLTPYSRCMANITAASAERPGVHMDHSPKHVWWWHHHHSPRASFPTKWDSGWLMSSHPFPTQTGQTQSVTLFSSLHCFSWKRKSNTFTLCT